ncbi:hypothetical protein FQN54_005705 [Arachnomyces sp. PD_36]|nr:hypothetical protein FQN54_005705 [Arachnomyces sp. PD_36]
MLHTRLPIRSLQQSCRCFSSAVPRAAPSQLQKRLPKKQLKKAKKPVTTTPPPDFTPEITPTTTTPTSTTTVDPSIAFSPPPIRDEASLGIRRYKPRTPGIRHLRRPINDHLWKGRPLHKLTFPKKGHGKGGRNSTGRVTVRHRGGGHKRRIRIVDFSRDAPGPHVVERIEHDPGRSAHIALLSNKATGVKSYILAAEGMREGDVVQSFRAGIPDELWKSMGGTIDPGVLAARTAWRGNCLPLHMVPIGTLIYNIGLYEGKGGQLCRGAGTFGTVVSKGGDAYRTVNHESEKTEQELKNEEEGEKEELSAKDQAVRDQEERKRRKIADHVSVRLQSGEVRLLHKDCCATVGVASNAHYQYRQLGKAGRSRWLNIRPTVRGLAMNAMDHPHGGGRGKSKGNIDPKSPWGLPAKSGYKTRPRKRVNKAVVVARPRNQGKRRRGYN